MSQTVNMPKLGFDMAEGTLIRWVKAEGEEVHKGEVLAEIETDKATVEVESDYDGIINRHLVDEGTIVPVGDPIAIIAAPGEKVDAAQTVKKAGAVKKAVESQTAKTDTTQSLPPTQMIETQKGPAIKASPLAKRLAADLGIDLTRIKGTGPEGRIVKRDVKAAQSAQKAKPTPIEIEKFSPVQPEPKRKVLPPIFTVEDIPPDEHVPLTKLRGIIGRRMVDAKQKVPHFYVTHVYDFEKLIKLRKKLNAFLSDEDALSINDFIVKATALALRQYPNLNTSIDNEEIIRHGHINIGVAVALDDGLLTVVCRDADIKPLRIISRQIRDMVLRARQGKMRSDDIEGSTFSISNLGMYDVEDFIAIINPPEAAVLAVGSAREVPVVIDGELSIGINMKATLSADHRITDGAEAARFLNDLSVFIEEPTRLLL